MNTRKNTRLYTAHSPENLSVVIYSHDKRGVSFKVINRTGSNKGVSDEIGKIKMTHEQFELFRQLFSASIPPVEQWREMTEIWAAPETVSD